MDIDFSIRALKLSANQAMVISSLMGMAFHCRDGLPDWHPTTDHHIIIIIHSLSTFQHASTLPGAPAQVLIAMEGALDVNIIHLCCGPTMVMQC